MKVQLWGVRGSIPSPGPATVRYGGNTTSLYVEAGDRRIVIDAGTGIRELGLMLLQHQPLDLDLLITHTHWDHIHGFPFFVPAYIADNTLRIHGPVNFQRTLRETMDMQMEIMNQLLESMGVGQNIDLQA